VTYAVLACSGMDKAEGSLAREVAVRLAERTAAAIVCPVLLTRNPARYKKLPAKASLVVVDGCGTRCATRLATGLEVRAEHTILISDVLKARGLSLAESLRLNPAGLALVESIVDELAAWLSAPGGPLEAAPAGAPSPEMVPAAEAVAWEPPHDFTIVVHDKFEFRIPKTGYLFNENDVWVRPSGNRARVGISDFMQQRLTDITYFDPPGAGVRVEQFGEVGSVESTKAVFEVVAPAGGEVVAVNQEVVDSPELVNEDPYGRGWLAELELADWPGEKDLLLDGAEYAKTVERKAAEA